MLGRRECTVRRPGEAGHDRHRRASASSLQEFVTYHFPINVKINTQQVGGPSAGLAFTLAIIDDLTPGELTGGQAASP